MYIICLRRKNSFYNIFSLQENARSHIKPKRALGRFFLPIIRQVRGCRGLVQAGREERPSSPEVCSPSVAPGGIWGDEKAVRRGGLLIGLLTAAKTMQDSSEWSGGGSEEKNERVKEKRKTLGRRIVWRQCSARRCVLFCDGDEVFDVLTARLLYKIKRVLINSFGGNHERDRDGEKY